MLVFKILVVIFLIIVIAVLLESYRENRIFKVTKYELTTSAIKPDKQIKIVFLSDLHNHVYGDNNQELLSSIRNEHPDVILVGGDMLIGKHEIKMDAAIKFCCQLPEIAPVYYALGNHERRMKECPDKYGTVIYDYIEELKAYGIHFLENESVEVTFQDSSFRITGLDLPLESYEKSCKKKINGNYIKDYVESGRKDIFRIMLAHNPEYFKAYKEWGADIVLSGHFHGGVARIPGWRGVITPRLKFFPKYSGEMTTEEEHTIIVSKGLGTHTIHFRIFNYPEVIVLELHR